MQPRHKRSPPCNFNMLGGADSYCPDFGCSVRGFRTRHRHPLHIGTSSGPYRFQSQSHQFRQDIPQQRQRPRAGARTHRLHGARSAHARGTHHRGGHSIARRSIPEQCAPCQRSCTSVHLHPPGALFVSRQHLCHIHYPRGLGRHAHDARRRQHHPLWSRGAQLPRPDSQHRRRHPRTAPQEPRWGRSLRLHAPPRAALPAPSLRAGGLRHPLALLPH